MDDIDETSGILTLDGKRYEMNKLPPEITVRACLEGLKVKIRAAKDRGELWKSMKSGRWPTRKRNKFPAGVQVLAWLTEVDIDTAWERFQLMDKKAKRVLARHPAAKVVQLANFNVNVPTKALKGLLVEAIDEATKIKDDPAPEAEIPLPGSLVAQHARKKQGDGPAPEAAEPRPMPAKGHAGVVHTAKKKKGKVIRKGQAKTSDSGTPAAQ